MKIRTVLLILFLALIFMFAAVNWQEFTRPTSLSFLVATVQAPLGLVMLGLTVALTVMFIAYALYLQTAMLLESRRHAKEMQSQRELAEHAEASRIAELRNLILSEMTKIDMQAEAFQTATSERLNQMEKHLLAAFEENGNSVAASIGELDDRIVRQSNPRPGTALSTDTIAVSGPVDGTGTGDPVDSTLRR